MLFENKFVVYTKDNCPSCSSVKSLLATNGLVYEEIRLVAFNPTDKQMLLETFKNLNPHVRSVPYIMYGSSPIGGMQDLIKLIKEKSNTVNKSQILSEGK